MCRRDLLRPADLVVGQVLLVEDVEVAAASADAPRGGNGDVDAVRVDVAHLESSKCGPAGDQHVDSESVDALYVHACYSHYE